MNITAVSVAPDGNCDFPVLPATRVDQDGELRAVIGCRELDGTSLGHDGDMFHMWFDVDQTAELLPINHVAGIITDDGRVVRGTVVFTGSVTPAGPMMHLQRRLVRLIASITYQPPAS